MDPHTAGGGGPHSRRLAYRLKVPVGGAGVGREPIGAEDALQVVLVASQVVAGHEVPGS